MLPSIEKNGHHRKFEIIKLSSQNLKKVCKLHDEEPVGLNPELYPNQNLI